VSCPSTPARALILATDGELAHLSHEEANYNRPISLLPILSKICEKTALNQFMPYLVANDRLTTKQSGNKRWHSTETTLIRTIDFILNAMDKRKITAIVLLDMSKARVGKLLNK
jgi:selenophosphate synthase